MITAHANQILLGPCDASQALGPSEFFSRLKTLTDKFVEANAGEFCGIKFIFQTGRHVDPDVVQTQIEKVRNPWFDITVHITTLMFMKLFQAQQLIDEFPGFIIGFDLVAQEDPGRPLIDFAPILIEAAKNPTMKYFFHAGETDWEGNVTALVDSNRTIGLILEVL